VKTAHPFSVQSLNVIEVGDRGIYRNRGYRHAAASARRAIQHFGPSARVGTAISVKVLCPGQVPALIAKFESTGTPVPL
jgi:hypothetical protein